jgi:hypothetical protein
MTERRDERTFGLLGVLEHFIAEDVVDLFALQGRLFADFLIDSEHVGAGIAKESQPVLRSGLYEQHIGAVRAEQHHLAMVMFFCFL